MTDNRNLIVLAGHYNISCPEDVNSYSVIDFPNFALLAMVLRMPIVNKVRAAKVVSNLTHGDALQITIHDLIEQCEEP